MAFRGSRPPGFGGRQTGDIHLVNHNLSKTSQAYSLINPRLQLTTDKYIQDRNNNNIPQQNNSLRHLMSYTRRLVQGTLPPAPDSQPLSLPYIHVLTPTRAKIQQKFEDFVHVDVQYSESDAILWLTCPASSFG